MFSYIESWRDLFLLLSNDILIAVFVCVLHIKSNYLDLLFLLFTTMICKTILKGLFHHNFPSGHICFASVFYGWFMIYKRSIPSYIFGFSALYLTSCAIINKGYHGPFEVIFTPIISLIILMGYYQLSKRFKADQLRTMFILFALFSQFVSFQLFGHLKLDLAIASYAILGLVTGQVITRSYSNYLLVIGSAITFLILGNRAF